MSVVALATRNITAIRPFIEFSLPPFIEFLSPIEWRTISLRSLHRVDVSEQLDPPHYCCKFDGCQLVRRSVRQVHNTSNRRGNRCPASRGRKSAAEKRNPTEVSYSDEEIRIEVNLTLDEKGWSNSEVHPDLSKAEERCYGIGAV